MCQSPNQMNAAAATQQMVDLFDILGIVHFGIAGNAYDSMPIGDSKTIRSYWHLGLAGMNSSPLSVVSMHLLC